MIRLGISMSRCLAMVALLALIAQACTKKPESHALTPKPGNYPMTAFRSDYGTWNCQQLADEADLLKECACGGIRAACRRQGGAPESRNREGSQRKDFEEV